MTSRRAELDKRIGAVRAFMAQLSAQLSPQLSAHWLDSAGELLDNDEPSEALIQLAWGIATDRIQVPAESLRFIEEMVGDRHDLPVDLSE